MESVQAKNCVLDKDAVKRKLKRMALEINEQNSGETDLIIAGINGNGEKVAAKLIEELNKITSFKIEQTIIRLNKKEPLHVTISPEVNCTNKVVIVVDDVANSGKTMLYALTPFLSSHPKKIQTLALVERSHKLFPVQTDYTGLSIATTLQEHISVETNEEEITGAWLF